MTKDILYIPLTACALLVSSLSPKITLIYYDGRPVLTSSWTVSWLIIAMAIPIILLSEVSLSENILILPIILIL